MDYSPPPLPPLPKSDSLPLSEVIQQELSDQQKKEIMASQDFLSFFDSATRIVEKAITEEGDVAFPYSGTIQGEG